MKQNILLLTGNKKIFYSFQSAYSNTANFYMIDPLDLYTNALPYNGSFQFIIVECNYTCSLTKCFKVFNWVLNTETPFIFIKRALMCRKSSATYYFCNYHDVSLTDYHHNLIRKLKNSHIYAFSNQNCPCPSSLIYKILKIQKEVTEHPFRKTSLSELAKSADISPNWLSIQFKKYSTIGLDTFIRKNVFCHSLWKIVSSNDSLKSIAHDHGYRPYSFTRGFKVIFNKPPSLIRDYKYKEDAN